MCNVIIPYETIEHPFVLNTSRLGIDFEFNGTCLQVTIRYKKVNGSDHAVRRSFFFPDVAMPFPELFWVLQLQLFTQSVNKRFGYEVMMQAFPFYIWKREDFFFIRIFLAILTTVGISFVTIIACRDTILAKIFLDFCSTASFSGQPRKFPV